MTEQSADQKPDNDRKIFERVAKIVAKEFGVPCDRITPESHLIKDFETDDLDIVYQNIVDNINLAFRIKLPCEEQVGLIQKGEATSNEVFIVKNLCARIDKLVAANEAANKRAPTSTDMSGAYHHTPHSFRPRRHRFPEP
jgi:acyl carrier protein